jgi:hypothetical protein
MVFIEAKKALHPRPTPIGLQYVNYHIFYDIFMNKCYDT